MAKEKHLVTSIKEISSDQQLISQQKPYRLEENGVIQSAKRKLSAKDTTFSKIILHK